jgi:hypothetical protein
MVGLTVATATKPKTKADLLAQYKRTVYNQPIEWARRALGFHPHGQQIDVMNLVRDHKRIAVRSAQAVGKTKLAAALVLWYLNSHAPGYAIISGASWDSIKYSIWPEIHRLRVEAPCQEMTQAGRAAMMAWELGPHWGEFSVSPKHPEGFAGFRTPYGVFVIIDEASALTPEIMEAIEGLCATEGSKILLIGNPLRPSGPFFEAFRSPIWATYHMRLAYTPNVITGQNIIPGLATREWVDERKAEWGVKHPAYIARVLGKFPDESERQLIPLSWAEDAAVRAKERKEPLSGPKKMGIDVAEFGDDLTVFQVVHGNHALEPFVTGKRGPMEVAGLTLEMMRKHDLRPEDVKMDTTGGWGTGPCDRLHEQGYQIIGINVSRAPMDGETFLNARAEAGWMLREWIEHGGEIPNDQELKADLVAPEYGYTSSGKMKLEPKELTKKRLGGRSPDRFDALMLAIYEPVDQGDDIIVTGETLFGEM